MDQALEQGILEAIENGNKRKLNSLLGCPPKKELPSRSSLLASTVLAKQLLDIVTGTLSSRATASLASSEESSKLTFEQAFHATLMIHPSYETPWISISRLAYNGTKNISLEEIYHCTSAVEIFLCDIADGEDRSQLTDGSEGQAHRPAYMSFIMKALRDARTKLWNNDCDSAFSHEDAMHGARNELLRDFVMILSSFARWSGDQETQEKVNELLFMETPHPCRLVDWFYICRASSPSTWTREFQEMRSKLVQCLERDDICIPVPVLKALLDMAIVETKSEVNRVTSSTSTLTGWCLLFVKVLIHTHDRELDYDQLESHVFFLLEKSSTRDLAEICSSICQILTQELYKVCPKWVKASILLKVCECLQNSDATNLCSPLTEKLSGDDFLSEITKVCQKQLLDEIYSDNASAGDHSSLHDILNTNQDLVVSLLDNTIYQGAGIFTDNEGIRLVSLTTAGECIFQVLHAGKRFSISTQKKIDIEMRGRRWLNQKEYFDEAVGVQVISSRAILFGILVQTIVYYEVAACRELVLSAMSRAFQNVSGKASTGHVSNVSLSVIVASAVRDDGSVIDLDLLKPILKLLNQPINTESLHHLFAILSSIPPAKPSILAKVKGLLESGKFDSWVEKGNSKAPVEDYTQAGLVGLLELLRDSFSGKEAIEAWKILSECFVLDDPALRASTRSWLYDSILDLVNENELPEDSTRHFLTATIIRAARLLLKESAESSLRFAPENAFTVWEDPNNGIIQTKQIEDVAGLFQTLHSLLFDGVQTEHAGRHSMLVECHGVILSRVMGFKEQTLNNRSNSLEKFLRDHQSYHHGKDTNISSSTGILCYAILMATALDYAVVGSSRNSEKEIPTSDDLGRPKPESLFKNLIETETLSFGERLSHDSTGYFLPSWTREEHKNTALFSTQEADVDSSWLGPIQSSILDLLIEFLCNPVIRRLGSQRASNGTPRDIVLSVGYLLQQKNLIAPSDSQHPVVLSRLSSNTSARSGVEFFIAASRAAQDLLNENWDVGQGEELLAAIIAFCSEISNLASGKHLQTNSLLLQSVWTLYQIVASERGAIQFVNYFEHHCPYETPQIEVDTNYFSLQSMRNSVDVDQCVQKIRLSVLQTLFATFEHVPNPRPKNEQDTPIPGARTNQEDSIEVNLILSLLKALSLDLRAGLEGQSGGITTDMFKSFISSIQQCISLVYDFSMCDGFVTPARLPAVLSSVIDTFCEILKLFPLTNAVIFRSSFLLATSVIPSILTDVQREQILRGTASDSQVQPSSGTADQFLVAVFKDCVFILKRWSSIRDPNSLPWVDIAGKRHTDPFQPDSNDKKKHYDEETQSYSVPQIVQVPSKTALVHGRHAPDFCGIQLRSKEMWSWALSCIFVTFEGKWLESFRAISIGESHPARLTESTKMMLLNGHFLARKQELLSSLTLISEIFQSSTSLISTMTDEAALDMLAMNMPSAPRRRLCHMISTTAKTLKLAVTYSWAIFDSTKGQNREPHPFYSIGEALSCLAAWLLFDEKDLDFSVSLFRWLSMLRRKLPVGELANKRGETSHLVQYLSGVSDLIRDLFEELKRLQRVMEKGFTIPYADVFDPWIQALFGEDGRSRMVLLISQKIKLLNQSVPSEYLSSEVPESAFPTGSLKGRKREAGRRGNLTRPRKRNVSLTTRSRNRIVNMFMSLDKETGDNEGGVDAFVDLEDFLVEG